MKYILAIDQGTTGTTALLVETQKFQIVGKLNKEFPQIFPKPSWVEHDLNDIWSTVRETVSELLKQKNISSSDIVSIGITNQRETTCAFDLEGKPLANAIVWQDRRTESRCSELSVLENKIKLTTGLTVDAYFSGTKIEWLLKNNQEVKNALENKTLRVGTIDTYLLNRLTSGDSHKTDSSNASRTMLMDLKTLSWDDELLNTLSIPKDILPEINHSIGDFGKTRGLDFLPDGIPITGILGDQQSALFGQLCHREGELKCTYGTGAFLLINTGEEIKYSNSGLLTTVAYSDSQRTVYALEGSTYIAGAAVQWLRDNLGIIENSPEVESLARNISNLEEVQDIHFLPFFTGIGSPHWISNAKAAIVGMTRGTSNSHIAWSCLEGIALSVNDLINAMRKDTGLAVDKIKVDGGASLNSLLLDFQSNSSQAEIIRPRVIETTAYGAVLSAALGAKLISRDEMNSLWEKDISVSPEAKLSQYFDQKTNSWSNLIKKLYS